MIFPKTVGYFPTESIKLPLKYFKFIGLTQPHLAPKRLEEGVSSILKFHVAGIVVAFSN